MRRLLFGLFLLSACQSPPQASPLRWYSSCGDPVCGNPNLPIPANSCGSRLEGQACTQEGESCELGNECRQRLVCARSDPKLQAGACPISKAEFKQKVHFLSAAEKARFAQELMQMPLATWEYKHAPGKSQLGFLIQAGTPAYLTQGTGNIVDLYGYLSLAVATIHTQQTQIQDLTKRLEALEQRD